MHTIVCMKQIIDPEVPPHLFEIDPEEMEQVRGTHPLVISAYDEVAIEIALQLKEKTNGKVTVITIGDEDAVESLHQALAMGVDQAIRVTDSAFEDAGAFERAQILAAAVRKVGDFDVALCGRQAGDVELGLTGPFLAEELGLPCATIIANIEPINGKVRMQRSVDIGYEVLEAPVPFVGTVTNDESNVPRYASVRGMLAARRAEIPVWSADDLGIDPSGLGLASAQIAIDELYIPERVVECELIAGETGPERATNLVDYLKKEKV
ncbi:MAG: electron transfer flavoprotein subunit beta/FixA family protein, partial [Anaerolineae bacterium]